MYFLVYRFFSFRFSSLKREKNLFYWFTE